MFPVLGVSEYKFANSSSNVGMVQHRKTAAWFGCYTVLKALFIHCFSIANLTAYNHTIDLNTIEVFDILDNYKLSKDLSSFLLYLQLLQLHFHLLAQC